MASPDASGARAGETSAETAAQVTAAFRAAARARRGQHQKPVDVLRRAFASSCPGDGRASPEDFRVTATKLGLEIPVKDVLAVFETSEHVMREDGGKENALAGEETPEADEDEAHRRSHSRKPQPQPQPLAKERRRPANCMGRTFLILCVQILVLTGWGGIRTMQNQAPGYLH